MSSRSLSKKETAVSSKKMREESEKNLEQTPIKDKKKGSTHWATTMTEPVVFVSVGEMKGYQDKILLLQQQVVSLQTRVRKSDDTFEIFFSFVLIVTVANHWRAS